MELSLATALGPESMLAVAENVVRIEMFHDVRDDYMLHQFRAYAGEGDGTIVGSFEAFSFLVNRGNISLSPIMGYDSSS